MSGDVEGAAGGGGDSRLEAAAGEGKDIEVLESNSKDERLGDKRELCWPPCKEYTDLLVSISDLEKGKQCLKIPHYKISISTLHDVL